MDNKDLYDLSTIDQSSDINEYYGSNDFGYFTNSEQDLYTELDSSQSDYLTFDEAETIPETYEELLKLSIPIVNEVKNLFILIRIALVILIFNINSHKTLFKK